MKKLERKNVLLAAGLLLFMVLSIAAYSTYTEQQIYNESTRNLLSTYEQVTKTFNMFVQRNRNILDDWATDLEALDGDENAPQKWRRYVEEKANWQYSEVGLFNEEEQYWTVGGRQGDAPHMKAALEELYASDEPVVTSYISSKGVRKVLFGVKVDPVTMDGVTYTSLAICYDNSALESLLGGLAYEGQSDCYIVRADGSVVLSTEPKTEIPERLTNLYDYLQQNAQVEQPDFDAMQSNISRRVSGNMVYQLHGKSYYMVYQPVGIQGWAIVGIVSRNTVDAGMNQVQANTIVLLTVLAGLIFAGAAKIVLDAERHRREQEEAARLELQRRKQLTEEMFQGMARIVDRFAVCDLEADHYEYHERSGAPLYPAEGNYQELLEKISRKYVVMTDGENAKMIQMLAPENLRALLVTANDTLKLEYAARDRSAFMMMTVVPAGWENGRLTRVMMISQDMGEQHMLRDMANTDELTGLLNKRYFNALQQALVRRGQKYALFYLDLDRFKPVNDTYGHDVGDKLLCAVARRLQGCIRSRDYAFRLGGDEFALLVVGEMEPVTCRRKVEKIRNTVSVPYTFDGLRVVIGSSCGFALYPEEGMDADSICRLADQRMYRDKQKNHALQDHGLVKE